MSGEAVINDPGFPNLNVLTTLWRSLVGDPNGEIIQDGEATICQPILNSALRKLYREIRGISGPELIRDNVIFLNLPPMNSPSFGIGVPDPTVQVGLTYTGWYDGSQFNGNFLLPADCLRVLEVWQRTSNGGNMSFSRIDEAADGLNPGKQSSSLGQFEWRQNALWFNGSTVNMDIRVRYLMKANTFFGVTGAQYPNTLVPIQDCEDAVAYYCAYLYDLGNVGTSPIALEESKKLAEDAMFDLKNEIVRSMQGTDYHRQPYGNSYDGGGRILGQ
jgi:hypothetical protein